MNNEKGTSLTKELSKLTTYFVPDDVLALTKGIDILSTMKNNVIALDNALLQLAKTSDLSSGELKSLTDEAFRLGNAVGKTGTEVLSSITAARQAGYDMKDALKLTEESLKLTNISNNITDADTAMKNLKNIIDNFGENNDFAAKINDAVAGISNTEVIDFDTLMKGMSQLSDSADQAGMSLEETLGLLTGAYEVIGDMDKVTNGELSIFSSLQDTYGEAENVYDILEKLHSEWNKTDEASKDTFAVSIAGEDQKEIFTAIMDNWNGVEQAVYSASNSFGSANEANEVYLDTIAGKTETFKNQMEQLSAAVINSDLLKFFLDLGTTGVGALDSIINKFGAFNTLAAVGGAYLSSKGVG